MNNIRKQATADLVGRMPPFNEEAEQAVLAAMMHYEDMHDRIATTVGPADFHVPRHAVIFSAMLDLHRAGAPIEPRSLAESLASSGNLEAAGGAEYINDLWYQDVLGANGVYYAQVVAKKSQQRQLINMCARIMTDVYDTPWDQTEHLLDGAVQQISLLADSGAEGHAIRLCEPPVREDVRARLRALAKDPDAGAVSTGYLDLDRRLEGGLRPDELWILAGQTGGCKTALATGIAYNAAMGGKRVAMFSLEMSVAQMEDRLLSIASGVPLAKLRRPAILNTADWEAIDRTDALLAACDIVIDDTPALSPFDLHARCSRLRRERGLDLIVVDYLQIMGSNGRAATRELEVSAISKGLKSLAKEISVPVLALSQLNRNASSREDQRPILDDLRESGAIAQDADGVLFVHRTDDPRNENGAAVVPVEAIIAKQRNGAQGTVRLLLERQTAALYNSSPEEFSSTSSPAPRPAFPPREVCPF